MWTGTHGHGWDSTENIFPRELLGFSSKASHHCDWLLATRVTARCVCTWAMPSVKQDPLWLRLRRPPDRACCYWAQTYLCSWAPWFWDILVSDMEERMCSKSENPTQLKSPAPHEVSSRCKVPLWAAPSTPCLRTGPPGAVHPGLTFSFTLSPSFHLAAP